MKTVQKGISGFLAAMLLLFSGALYTKASESGREGEALTRSDKPAGLDAGVWLSSMATSFGSGSQLNRTSFTAYEEQAESGVPASSTRKLDQPYVRVLSAMMMYAGASSEESRTTALLTSDQVIKAASRNDVQVEQIEIWSSGDNSKKLDSLTVTENKGTSFEVKLFPEGATDSSWTAHTGNPDIAFVAEQQGEWTVVGLKEGETSLTVVSGENPDISSTILLRVVPEDFVLLEGVEFKQAKYTNKTYGPVESLIEWIPSSATGYEIIKVAASEKGVVSITGNKKYGFFIEAVGASRGSTLVTVTVMQKRQGGQNVKKQATAIFETGPVAEENAPEEIDGRW